MIIYVDNYDYIDKNIFDVRVDRQKAREELIK